MTVAFDLIYFITVFTAIFAIVDPIGNIPIFYSITKSYNKDERRKIIKEMQERGSKPIDRKILKQFGIETRSLVEIASSSENYKDSA